MASSIMWTATWATANSKKSCVSEVAVLAFWAWGDAAEPSWRSRSMKKATISYRNNKMNWLAHSSSFSELLVRVSALAICRAGHSCRGGIGKRLPAKYQAGIECHQVIDTFTDSHAIFRRSVNRIEAPFRRYGGILVDVFYDHLLARTWSRGMSEFLWINLSASSMHRCPRTGMNCRRLLIRACFQPMKTGDWLCSYRELAGVRRALAGIGTRFRKPLPLDEAAVQLELHYDALHDDFAEFFPELSLHVERNGERKK